jgi:MFS family permease
MPIAKLGLENWILIGLVVLFFVGLVVAGLIGRRRDRSRDPKGVAVKAFLISLGLMMLIIILIGVFANWYWAAGAWFSIGVAHWWLSSAYSWLDEFAEAMLVLMGPVGLALNIKDAVNREPV